MKVKISKDEWYPVYEISVNDWLSHYEIDLSDSEIAMIEAADKDFRGARANQEQD